MKWSAHTHPGNSDNVLNASGVPGDRQVLEYFEQEQSLILNSTGRRNLFNREDNFHLTSSKNKQSVKLSKKTRP